MQEKSLADRVVRDSTKAITASPENVEQVAQFLFFDREQTQAAHRALDGEPLKRVLAVLDWLLRHEQDDSYDPRKMLLGWARKRGAGEWRPPRGERIIHGSGDPDPDGDIERSLSGRSLPSGKWGRFSNEEVARNLQRMEAGS